MLPPNVKFGIKTPGNTPEQIYTWAANGYIPTVLTHVLNEKTEDVVSALGEMGVSQWFLGVLSNLDKQDSDAKNAFALPVQLAIIKFRDVISRNEWEPWWRSNFTVVPDTPSLINVTRRRSYGVETALNINQAIEVIISAKANKHIIREVIDSMSQCKLYQNGPVTTTVPMDFNTARLRQIMTGPVRRETNEVVEPLIEWVRLAVIPDQIGEITDFKSLRTLFLNTVCVKKFGRESKRSRVVENYVASFAAGWTTSSNAARSLLLITGVLLKQSFLTPAYESLYEAWKEATESLINSSARLSATEKVYLRAAVEDFVTSSETPEGCVEATYSRYLDLCELDKN